MAALSLDERQMKKSLNFKKQKKQTSSRAVLCSPYVAKWPPVEGSVQQNVLTLLKQFFDPHVVNGSGQSEADVVDRSKQHELRQLVCGINRVTRCLERDQLILVVVDRSSPWQLHQHLAQLSAVRQCKAIAIDNLSTSLSSYLAVTRLCAVGFKREPSQAASSSGLMKLAEAVGSLCPSIELPWLECDSYLRTLKVDRVQEQEQCRGDSGSTTLCDTIECTYKNSTNTVTERIQEPKDYSHLYIYKSLQADSSNKPAEFISLPSSSDEDNYTDDDDAAAEASEVIPVSPVKVPAKKAKKRLTGKIEYRPANVGLQLTNLRKKRRKS